MRNDILFHLLSCGYLVIQYSLCCFPKTGNCPKCGNLCPKMKRNLNYKIQQLSKYQSFKKMAFELFMFWHA